MLLAQGQANLTANAKQFFAETEKIRTDLGKLTKTPTTIDIRARMESGTLTSLRNTIRTSLDIIAKSASVGVGVNVKAGSTAKVRAEIDKIVNSVSGRVIDIKVNLTGAAQKDVTAIVSAVKSFDKLAAGGATRTMKLDVVLAPGLATKFKTVTSLIDSIKQKGDIKIKIDVDAAVLAPLKDLRKVLNQANSAAQQLKATLGSMPPPVPPAAAASAQAATVAQSGYNNALLHTINSIRRYAVGYLGVKLLIDGTRNLKEATIGYNETLVNTTQTLEAMLGGNKPLVASVLKDMQSFAERTPYAFKELVPILTQLKLAKIDADRLVPSMEALGNVAAVTGNGAEGIARMAASFRDAAARGRFTGEEIRELSRQAIPVYAYIAKSWNISQQQAQEYVRKGLIPAKQATDAIIKGAAGDKMFAGALERRSKTLVGSLANIGDVLQRVVAGGFEKSYQNATKFFNRISRFVQTKEFINWGKQTVATISDTFTRIGAVFVWLMQTAWKLRAVIGVVMGFIIARSIAAAVTGMMPLITTMIRATGVALVMGASILQAIVATHPAMKLLMLAVLMYANNWLQARTVINGVIVGITGLIGDMQVGFASLLETVAKLDVTNITGLKGLGDDYAQQVRNEADQRTAAMEVTLEAFGKQIDQAKKGVLDLFKNIGDPFNIGKLVDEWNKSSTDAANKAIKKNKVEMPNYEGQFTNGGKDGDKAAKRAAADRLRREKDALRDNAAAWKSYADAVVVAAKRQMDAYKDLQSSLTDLFDSMQSRLLSLGLITNPLGHIFESLKESLNLGDKMRGLASYTNAVVTEANKYQENSQSALERKSKQDGIVPSQIARGMSGGNGKDAGVAITEQVLAGVKTTRGISNCANVAGQILNNMGIAIRKNNFAKSLAMNAEAMGARKIPVSEANSGDLLVYRGNKYGAKQRNGRRSGYHVAVSDGPGTYAGNRGGGDYSVVRGRSNYGATYAYDTSVFARQTGARQQNRGRLQQMFGVKPTMTNIEGNAFEGTVLEGSLNKLSSVPRSWGKAIQETKRNASEFAMQTQMANKAFQNQLTEIAALTQKKGETMKQSFQRVVQWMRTLAQTTDQYFNRTQAIQQSNENVRGINRDIALRGKGNDPIAQLRHDFTKGDRIDTPKQQRQNEIFAVRRKIVGEIAHETQRLANAQNRENNFQEAAMRYLDGTTAGQIAYADALERANIKLAIQNELQAELNSSDKGVKAKALQAVNDRAAEAYAKLDAGKIRGYVKAIDDLNVAHSDRIDNLQAEAQLIGSGMSQNKIAAVMGVQAEAQRAFNEARRVGANVTDAMSEAQRVFNNALEIEKMERYNSQQREMLKQRRDILATLELERNINVIRVGSAAGSLDQDRQRHIAKATSDLMKDVAENSAGVTETMENMVYAMAQLGIIAQQFDIDARGAANDDYDAIMQQSADATANIGVNAEQAALKIRMLRGDLSLLTADQQKAYEKAVANIKGVEYANSQIQQAREMTAESANSVIEMQIELEERRGAITTEVQKQILKWNLEDNLARIQGIELTKEASAAMQEARRAALEALQQIDDQTAANRVADTWLKVGADIKSVFNDAFGSIAEEGLGGFADKMIDGILNLMDKIAAEILASAAMKLLGDMLGMSLGGGTSDYDFGGARATGGPVSRGKAYLVGENGREMFVPSASGTIISEKQAVARGLLGQTSGSTFGGHSNTSSTGGNSVVYQVHVEHLHANNPDELMDNVSRVSEGQQARRIAELSQRGQRAQ